MRDITSADGKDNAASMAKPGEGISVTEALEKDVRKKKKLTNDNVEISNFEQYILSQNIDKAANYFMANQDLFNYRTFIPRVFLRYLLYASFMLTNTS